MGFLRKVGRKVKKKLNKVFGTTLGSIVGMVGLYFTMGWAAKSLVGWAKGTFGAAEAAAAAQGAQAAELTATVGAKAGATFEAKVAADAAVVSTAAADATIASTVSSTGASVGTLMANSTTNADKLNAFMGAQESAVQAGTSASTLNTTLTEAVSTAANDPTLLSQTTAEVTANLSAQPIDFAKEGLFKTDMFASEAGNLVAKEGVSVAQAAADPARFATLGPDATMGQRLGRFAQDPIGITRGAIQNTAATAIDYATGPDFIPDTLQAGATGYVNNALAEEQTGQRIGGQVMGQPMNEIAQSAYMQSVGPQLQNSGLAGVRTFADLSNQTIYGTGTPDYLRNLYQPLPMPSPLQLG